RLTPTPSLFPYTTLFRSLVGAVDDLQPQRVGVELDRAPQVGDDQRGGHVGDVRLVQALLGQQQLADVVRDHGAVLGRGALPRRQDRKSTRLNSSHVKISY